ncbi:L-ascorbate metabolism protein UlaG, beta-lactamase superfamily [Hymenobacter daecheongensis DSM 21074]|uniref:L-ascorbate metabolism protein UlaG, beta-lactamase superfamily n=1 Tax=Hymenobacter daecheongensis DSM 21074 TaxID=1121955 RepID=A0A1M6LS21_9BACT|nr:MBL fold metallo-hydrolase [Hymenobacter daecheongensis]SHJ73980.1 L-ascorbate metabolism protein UlaG, beta-lactamase superfamily [Hymenobacter daecheongensis DSM 21074]
MSSITYARNEQLRTVKPNYPGNKLFGRQFANGEELYNPDFSNVFRWKFLTENPQKEEKKADTWVPEVVDCTAFLQGDQDGLVWLGHASFVLRSGGVTLLFDPILFDSAFLKRRHPLPCRPEALTNIDLLLLSHGHRDHLDEASLKLLARQNPTMQVLTGLGMAAVLRGMAPGLTVQEAGWWQQYDLHHAAPLEIQYLPASHWYRRGLLDMNKVLWGSFLIRAQDKLIYFGADSSYAGHFEEIERQFGPLDIALLGIGAYKPAFMMQGSHTNPHEAAKAANVLRAGHLVPMHHGTFDLSDEPASEPLRTLQEIAAGGMLRGELHAPAVGEVLRWPEWE